MARHDIAITHPGPAPSRIDDILNAELPGRLIPILGTEMVSKSKIRRLIVAGAVSVSGRQTRNPASRVLPGHQIMVFIDTEKLTFEKTPDDIDFEMSESLILFEDDALIAVNKPAGIPTEATIVASRDSLHAALKRYLWARDKTRNEPYVGVHHRLDRETSGVILFTKTRAVNAPVHALFEGHLARKEYEALTAIAHGGNATQHENAFCPGYTFSVENSLDRISAKSAQAKWGAVSSGGVNAFTDFEVLERFNLALRILALPRTGRTHQIRVHLSSLGFPLLGDPLYGGPARLGSISIPRVMLHARSLSFPHPVTGTPMSIPAPLPEDFSACLRSLSKK
jgi:23S rRNA pseudouridine1911/1915/1917 synthase